MINLDNIARIYAEGMLKQKECEVEVWKEMLSRLECLDDNVLIDREEPKAKVRVKPVEELPPLLTPDQAAELLCVAKETLNIWRTRGDGPSYVKVGRLVRYKSETILEYIQGRQHSNTAQY